MGPPRARCRPRATTRGALAAEAAAAATEEAAVPAAWVGRGEGLRGAGWRRLSIAIARVSVASPRPRLSYLPPLLPTLVRPPRARSLPQLKSDEGETYYAHTATGETSWEFPKAGPPPLPAGWEQTTTDDGQVYFMNAATGATSWDRPSA